jgi:putative toxin-antitoxin system antitoxin component (TIGR02293 family)
MKPQASTRKSGPARSPKETVAAQQPSLARETAVAFPLVHAGRIDRLKERGFSTEELHRIVAPRRTLARRVQTGQRLSPAEADRVLRLERVIDLAERVFADGDKAHRWLRKESRALDGARPIDLLQTETGAHLVEDELHRIDHGMFA